MSTGERIIMSYQPSLRPDLVDTERALEKLTTAYSKAQIRMDALNKSIQLLLNEVNCRIEHGANSGGHLDYVEKELKKILDYAQLP